MFPVQRNQLITQTRDFLWSKLRNANELRGVHLCATVCFLSRATRPLHEYYSHFLFKQPVPHWVTQMSRITINPEYFSTNFHKHKQLIVIPIELNDHSTFWLSSWIIWNQMKLILRVGGIRCSKNDSMVRNHAHLEPSQSSHLLYRNHSNYDIKRLNG